MRREVFYIVFALLFLGLQIQPATITLDTGLGGEYDEIITFTNTRNTPLSFSLLPHPFSEYLTTDILLPRTNFFLEPQESANIQIRGTIPEWLGPETHELLFTLVTANRVLEEELSITIPITGFAVLDSDISIHVPAVQEGSPIIVETTFENYGNIIAYHAVTLQIYEEGILIGSTTYPQQIQVLPSQTVKMSFLYSAPLEPGVYRVVLESLINDDLIQSREQDVAVQMMVYERTVYQGQDLVLDIKQYNTSPRLEYSIRSQELILLEGNETVMSSAYTLHTRELPVGTYTVHIQLHSETLIDEHAFVLRVLPNTLFPTRVYVFLGVIVLLIVLFSQKTWLFMRVLFLTYRIYKKEKQLNTLIHKVQRLYGSK